MNEGHADEEHKHVICDLKTALRGGFFLIIVGFVTLLCILLPGSPDRHSGNNLERETKRYDFASEESELLKYHAIALNRVKKENLEKMVKDFASRPHSAGSLQAYKSAQWLKKKLKKFGWDTVNIKNYTGLMSFPKKAGTVSMRNKDSKVILKFESKEIQVNSSTIKETSSAPPYIAFSKTGKVKGRIIYGNYGRGIHYKYLHSLGVKVNGSISLVRYGLISRSQKVVAATKWGIKALIIFSDPEEVNPYGNAYPNSWYLPDDAVQIGNINRYRGDPLSQGYPSLKDMYRKKMTNYQDLFPDMHVLPISYAVAAKLMRKFRGIEIKDKRWVGKLNVTYRGEAGEGIEVEVTTDLYFEDKPIYNVIGTIVGRTEPDRYVIIGNHRDAWRYGAVDPSAATAALVEVARVLGWLMKKGWKPRRTIILGSWDAEEFGLYGSTEWCEEYASILTRQSIIYINVDSIVEGSYCPKLSASPHVQDAFYDVMKRIPSPRGNGSTYNLWVELNEDKEIKDEPRVQIFASGSDYMHFFATLGIAAMDFRFTFKEAKNSFFDYPTYHTLYDNYEWLHKYIDPDFKYHKVMTEAWVQVTLLFSDSVIIPYNVRRYGDMIMKDKEAIEKLISRVPKPKEIDPVLMQLLKDTCSEFRNATYKFHEHIESIDKDNVMHVRTINDKLMFFERTFTTVEDIPEESTTRHVYQFNQLEKLLNDIRTHSNIDHLIDMIKLKLQLYIHHIKMASKHLQSYSTTI